MSVPAAYLTVVLIWSTTPLAIQWSSIGVGYEFGVAARMLFGLLALLLILLMRGRSLPWNKQARTVYLVSGLSLFIAMSSVYWSAQFIPSGWISVIFGFAPVITSVFALLILRENRLTFARITGMLLGLLGLAVIFAEGFSLDDMAVFGVVGVTISAIAHSLGAVLLQKMKTTLPTLSITAGSLIVATPLFILNCVLNQAWPDDISVKTMGSISYLALLGTAIGFPLYYYLLKHLNAERVALITLITPVTALLIGSVFNNEVIGLPVWTGAALIVTGLSIYEYGKYLPIAKK